MEFKVKLVKLQDFPVVGANVVAKVKATSTQIFVKFFIMLVSLNIASQIEKYNLFGLWSKSFFAIQLSLKC